MKYLDTIAAIFWAWWHAGEALSLETLQANQWAANRDLNGALDQFRVLIEQASATQLVALPPIDSLGSEKSIQQLIDVSELSIPGISADPEYGRAMSYEAIAWNISVSDQVSFLEFTIHLQMFEFYLLLFAVSCYACHHPDEDIPISEEDIHVVVDRINERLNGVPSEGQNIQNIAWRIARLSPEGRTLEALLEQRGIKQLPPLSQIV